MTLQHRAEAYRAFLAEKVAFDKRLGFALSPTSLNPKLKDFQRDITRWMIEGGRRALFARFGLGKSVMQLETLRQIGQHVGGRQLVVMPLGVRYDFRRDAEMHFQGDCAIAPRFVRQTSELDGDGLYFTNYESVREGKLSVESFNAVSLDEASILRGFGGTKTFRQAMRIFEGTKYRFVATATPSPNQYIELLAYAAFLGIMEVSEAKTRFFQRNSEKADQLTLYPHKTEEFWIWVNTWAVFVQRPSDLGYSDESYDLPPLTVRWHAVPSDVVDLPALKSGQNVLIADDALGVQGAAAIKRSSLGARVAKANALISQHPSDHVILWHDLEDERRAIESSVSGVTSVYGAQDLDEREEAVAAFADGKLARLAAKPVMLGSGCNLQRHCHRAIYVGVGFKFNDFIQSLHRLHRFQQTHEVTVDIIYAESEAPVVKRLQEKWARHDEMMARMSAIIQEYGLHSIEAQQKLQRSIGKQRGVESGSTWTNANNDCVEELLAGHIQPDSVGGIFTSIPFSQQYEYTPSYNDFGHVDDDAHFFRQMDFLSPELLRVLMPGRVMCVHVKDRVRPGGMDGLGFQSVSPFHAKAILHYQSHGFIYAGMITVVTDVVRENNQTYRLGWTEQCKDGSRMSVGMPEYVLIFRKPPTDATDGYADTRVVKTKAEYTRARWQTDAHGFWRSNGNRLLAAADLVGLPADEVFRNFRAWSYATTYDYEQHVAIGEALDNAKRLPPGFMLLQPASWHEDVWTDIARMRTFNTLQGQHGREHHLCPLQFDLVRRLINRYTNPGELVLDPFGGLGTVAYEAVKAGRRGYSIELNTGYWADANRYLRAAEHQVDAPSLLDLAAALDETGTVVADVIEPEIAELVGAMEDAA